jgi:hypothetical protein
VVGVDCRNTDPGGLERGEDVCAPGRLGGRTVRPLRGGVDLVAGRDVLGDVFDQVSDPFRRVAGSGDDASTPDGRSRSTGS